MDEEGCTLCVYRAPTRQGGFRQFMIWVDGRRVAAVRAAWAVRIPVASGRHTLSVRIDWCGSPGVEFEATPGREAAFECGCDLTEWQRFYYPVFRRNEYLFLRRTEAADHQDPLRVRSLPSTTGQSTPKGTPVVGIVGFVFVLAGFLAPLVGLVGLILSVIGLVQAYREGRPDGLAWAGSIIGILSATWGLIMLLALLSGG